MLSLTEKEVDLIATQLLKGNVCFYQVDKKKIHHLPDDEDHFNYDLTPEEEDILDELYGFPSTMTEVTPIYLALGRRDLKLEYQHKTLRL